MTAWGGFMAVRKWAPLSAVEMRFSFPLFGPKLPVMAIRFIGDVICLRQGGDDLPQERLAERIARRGALVLVALPHDDEVKAGDNIGVVEVGSALCTSV